QAEEKYVVVHHARGQDLIEESLKSLEEEFGDLFVRIHRNCLVARRELSELRRGPDGHVQALLRSGGPALEVSRRCVPVLRQALQQPWGPAGQGQATGASVPRKAPGACFADNARMDTLRIATRKSPLALWQSEYVAARLRAAHPGLEVVLVPLSTRGDEVLDRSLAAIGGKGLFLKELELAMQRGEADCAVHSLKDVPMELEPGFALPAVLERADPADAFVSNACADLDALPQGAVVGTSS